MTNVKYNRKEFEKLLGKKVDKEVEEKISLFGTPLEAIDEGEIEIEIFPNRPDLIPLQGYVRSFKSFLGKKQEIKYTLKKPEKEFTVTIDPSVKEVRPYTACAIVKNLQFDNEKIKEIVELQEKLHLTVGRNRKKVAIGIYPLEKITLPITYEARSPDQIKFIPLESDREMTGTQILNRHPKGKDYAHLLDGHAKYPLFVDAQKKILSMPPIINSHETGKITEKTKDVFVECSGSNMETLKKTLNIIVTTLAEMNGKVYQMNLSYGKEKKVTPDLTPEKIKVIPENVNKLLGLNLKEAEMEKLLEKMGITYKNKTATVPAWRTDILHEVDIIEDVAIAYGYDKLTPEIPNIATVGEESKIEQTKAKLTEMLIGLGLTEITTFHLIKQQEAARMKHEEKIELKDSKTEYKLLRPNLLTPALRIMTENKDHDYPQEIFEIGTTFTKDETSETGVKESEHLCVVLSPANFTKAKQILEYITSQLDTTYSLSELNHPHLIEGRCAQVKINGTEAGFLGEVHPQTLRDWTIKMPISVLEISLDSFF